MQNPTVESVILQLQALSNPDKIAFKQKQFGIVSHNALGIYHHDLKRIARELGYQNDLACALFDSEIYEARLLCSKIYNPKDLTPALMEKWLVTFNNWEICDSFCMGFFSKGPYALEKIYEWVQREKEFEKRAGFATLASYCMADKFANNAVFENFLPKIFDAATDDRLYVKKAVNWALRNIGKRNPDLREAAIHTAQQIVKLDSKAARWIAKDALRELQNPTLKTLDYPRAHYRS